MEKQDDKVDQRAQLIAQAGAKTEQEMRDAEVPTPATLDELTAYIGTLTDRPHDYGTCVYAMSLAAVASFNYVAGKLGCTGFQSQCADLDIVRRIRMMKHGFMLIDGSQVLYPQYDIVENVRDFVERQRVGLAPEARKLLAENDRGVHPNVRAHWEKLAQLDSGEETPEKQP
jgi:hypothetical protein